MIDLTDTYLNTVNFLLEVMGSPPVQSVDDQNLPPDVAVCVARLNEEIITHQKRGWWFNRNYNSEFTPAIDKTISVANNCIKVTYYHQGGLILRGRKLYNAFTNSFEFDAPVCLDWIVALDWEDLPTSIQDSIRFTAAARICVTNLEDLHKANEYKLDASMAYAQLVAEDLEANQYNILNTPMAVKLRSGVRPLNSRLRVRGLRPR